MPLVDPLIATMVGETPLFTGLQAGTPIKKYIVDGRVSVSVARERVQYLNAQGKLITESLKDYTRINIARRFESLDKFLHEWNSTDQKAALIEELENQGVLFAALAEEVGKDLDPFDLVLHVAYNQPPLTRRERANRVKKRNVFGKCSAQSDRRVDRQVRRRRRGHQLRTSRQAARYQHQVQNLQICNLHYAASGGELNPERLKHWRNWATNAEGITGEALLEFVNHQLFPKLKAGGLPQ